ncbi:lytic transglycosylase domain-containing protein [Sphingomonas parapaucimobilis]
MKKWITGAALAAMITVPANAQPRRGNRQVQMIAMGGASEPTGPGARSEAGVPAGISSPPEIPGFAVHDLSRRYVEYRMANELRGNVEGVVPAPIDAANMAVPALPVAASSPISVPFWMRPAGPALPMAPAVFTPGCTPVGYRPSGILSRGAEARRAAFYANMSAIACEHGIPVGLFDAVIMRESRYDPAAISPKRAYGLTQLMPGTADGLGVNRFDIIGNLRGGARYLRQQLDRFGQVHLALAAYNAGPGRVRGGQIPRITETRDYVANILTNWSRLSGFGRVATLQASSSRGTPPLTSMPVRRSGVAVSTF